MPWNYKRDRHLDILKKLYENFDLNFFILKDALDALNMPSLNEGQIRYSIERNFHHCYVIKYNPKYRNIKYKNFRLVGSSMYDHQKEVYEEIKRSGKNEKYIHYKVTPEGIIALQEEGLIDDNEKRKEVAKHLLTHKNKVMKI